MEALFFAFWALVAVAFSAPAAPPPRCPVVLPVQSTSRIIGGNIASSDTRAHLVSFYKEGCGATVISPTWVLTAAHCQVQNASVARIAAADAGSGTEIPVKRVIDHPQYDFPKNDVTLVELHSPVPSSTRFMPINSNPAVPAIGEYARVAGYGYTEENYNPNHDGRLRQVDVPVVHPQSCIDSYFKVNSYLRQDISPSMHICAGYQTGSCDSCIADSGGPLFVFGADGRPIQVAIVSFGYGCAREVPGGYTRLSTYVSWMKSVGAVFSEASSRNPVFLDAIPTYTEAPTPSGTPTPSHTPTPIASQSSETASTIPSASPYVSMDDAEIPTASSGPSASDDSLPSRPSPGALPVPSPTIQEQPPPSEAVGEPAVFKPPIFDDFPGDIGDANENSNEIEPRPISDSDTSSSTEASAESEPGSNETLDEIPDGRPPEEAPQGEASESPGEDSTTEENPNDGYDSETAVNDGTGDEASSGDTQNDDAQAQSVAASPGLVGNPGNDAVSAESVPSANPEPESGVSDEGPPDDTRPDDRPHNNRPTGEGGIPTVTPEVSSGIEVPSGNSGDTQTLDEDNTVESDGDDEAGSSVGVDGDEKPAAAISASGTSVSEPSATAGESSDEGIGAEEATGAGLSEDGANEEDSTGSTDVQSGGSVNSPSYDGDPFMDLSDFGNEDVDEEFEGLEASASPEVEAKADSDATNAEVGADQGGLNGVQIAMIVLGTCAGAGVLGYAVYYLVDN